MNLENSSPTKVCPTCGTRLNENATRCLVCGRTFTPPVTKTSGKVQGPRMPEITLTLPVALGLMILILAVGAVVVFVVLRSSSPQAPGQVVLLSSPTVTTTPTQTLTPTTSPTGTPVPTFTELPPLVYEVKSGDYCSTIAGIFNVSIQSIILINKLPADCGTLYVGQKLSIPQPTPTASPLPTSTLSSNQATDVACDKFDYVVKEGDTPSGIANNYNVQWDSIKEYNGLTGDIVYQGQKLKIPLCKRNPTPGPTPTATNPPPYPAPNLLLPEDGKAFAGASETITLQWSGVGALRDNESYSVTIEDVTDGARKITDAVRDNKYIIPISFQPTGTIPHVIRWSVTTVRQAGTTKDGQPLWDSAGAISQPRVFSWIGSGSAAPLPTDTPASTPKP